MMDDPQLVALGDQLVEARHVAKRTPIGGNEVATGDERIGYRRPKLVVAEHRLEVVDGAACEVVLEKPFAVRAVTRPEGDLGGVE
jgi:hypothetical protein